MINTIETEARRDTQPPTTLNLLHFRAPHLDGTRINNFREKLSASITFEVQCQRTGVFLKNLFSEAEKRHDRIDHSEQDFLREGENLVSSENFADVYLKMRNAFPQMDFKDFIAAFKESLRIMLTASELLGWKDTGINTNSALLALSPNSKISNKLNDMVYKLLKSVPVGFTQGLSAWKSFLIHPDNFISGIPSSNRRTDQKRSQKANILFLIPSGVPDWFSDDMKDEPDKTRIQEEMKEDKQGGESFEKQFSAAYQQKLLNTNTTVKKMKETLQWIDSKSRNIFDNLNMTRLVLFLHFIEHSQNRIREAVRGIKIDSADNFNYLAETTDEYIENVIKQHSESEDVLKTPKSYALFLEKQFADAGINLSGNSINADFIKFIDMVIVSNKDRVKTSLSKKSADAINYGLQPLISILNADEINYIKELVGSYAGNSVEYFIWELSELLALKIEVSPDLNCPAKRVLNKVRAFSVTFLRRNWRWIYDNLKIELAGIDKGQSIVTDVNQNTIILLDNSISQNQSEEIQAENIGEIISEFQEGNLSGWRLYYSRNKSTDIKHLTEIDGRTLDEKEKALEDFIAKNQISSSIKPSSIINAFDWLVTVPMNIEEVRMTKNVNGEVFKKIKRGPVRIFYVMDETKKQIIFFLHQKQAWNYGF